MNKNFLDVIDIFAECLSKPPSEIRPELTLVQDLDMDSLHAVEVGMTIEDKFGIEISEAEGEKVFTPTSTVKDLIEFVDAKTGSILRG